MKTVAIQHFGTPDVFQVMDQPTPTVLPGQVLIRVEASSVNPVDVKIRQGAIADIAPAFPAVLHGDMAGTVEAVGEGVIDLQVGDQVYGCVGGVKELNGALAEYMVADARLVARKPQSLSMAAAAALPLVGITAWEGLIDRAQVHAGQKVLIYGGTGGVGHIGVQLAKWAGATVYATASTPEKGQIAQQLGADQILNYRRSTVEDWVADHTEDRGFDVVFDTIGNDNLQNAFRAAKINGTVVSLVSLSQQDLSLVHIKGLTLHLVFMLLPMLTRIDRDRHGQILTRLAQLVDQGQVRPLIDDHAFSFTEVGAAHQHLESGAALGKIVLTQTWGSPPKP